MSISLMKIFLIGIALGLVGMDAYSMISSDTVVSGSSPAILNRVFINARGLDRIGELSWNNPALMTYRYRESECSATLGYNSEKSDRPIVSAEGNGRQAMSIGADAYIHSGNSTVWGAASYDNGKILSPLWNESGTVSPISPYLLADSIGGNLSRESYSFSGGYAHSSDKLLWGVEGGYKAELSYRKIDPRPRNITGDLNIKGGLGWRLSPDYIGGLSLRYNHYRLSTDVSFVNETGETKLFHLTGLGSHYVRFDGAGRSVYNDYNAGELSLNLLPVADRGGFLNISGSLMKMRHVIEDLNRLPLADMDTKSFQIQAGYKGSANRDVHSSDLNGFRYAIWGEWYADKRLGTENIFGDATSGSYPLIGSLTLYRDNLFGGSISGFTGWTRGNFSVYVIPTLGWRHQRIVHLTDNREWLDEHLNLKVNSRFSILFKRAGYISFQAGVEGIIPTSSLISLPSPGTSPEDKILYNLTMSDFKAATASRVAFNAGAEWLYSFSTRLSGGIFAGFSNLHIANGITSRCWTIGITARFI